jgi:hypothetical protein
VGRLREVLLLRNMEAALVILFEDETIWTIPMTILNDDDGGISIRYTMSEPGLHICSFNLTFGAEHWVILYTSQRVLSLFFCCV